MHAIEDLHRLLSEAASEDPCAARCLEALAADEFRVIGSEHGKSAASDLLRTYTIREWTTRAAGSQICGFERTLRALAARPAGEEVWIRGLHGTAVYIVTFVAAKDGSLIGCLMVHRPPYRGIGPDGREIPE